VARMENSVRRYKLCVGKVGQSKVWRGEVYGGGGGTKA
jgi:hypothetical protein